MATKKKAAAPKAMDRDSMKKMAGALKAKAKKARGEGKRANAKAFKKGMRKLMRKLKATAPKAAAKAEAAPAS